MRSEHEEIKELLPDLLKGTLSREAAGHVETHLRECEECREEVDLLRDILGAEAPDPGDLFWKTLPGKIGLAARGEKPSGSLFGLFRSRAFAVGSCLAVLAFVTFTFLYVQLRRPAEYDPLFKDPLSGEVIDYSGLKESDIPPLMIRPPGEGGCPEAGNFMDYGYRQELAYLDTGEADRLLRILESEKRPGG